MMDVKAARLGQSPGFELAFWLRPFLLLSAFMLRLYVFTLFTFSMGLIPFCCKSFFKLKK